ncbi:calcium-transporting ATPase 8, plasma membrane-type-like [Euphorbia lathyris]|uniref:calcium-transporting ATPase 8, plasma membrane-type-like n=1 Tax=Euphorbia lathyris TaxID=212925 RepID=UPI00331346F2
MKSFTSSCRRLTELALLCCQRISNRALLEMGNRSVNEYKLSLQFQNLNGENRNMHMEVITSGKRVNVLIYDIVVENVFFLTVTR